MLYVNQLQKRSVKLGPNRHGSDPRAFRQGQSGEPRRRRPQYKSYGVFSCHRTETAVAAVCQA